MTTNVGTIDRVLRAVVGVGLLYLAFFSGFEAVSSPLINYGLALIGVVMLGVAVLSTCPIYAIFGIKTCGE